MLIDRLLSKHLTMLVQYDTIGVLKSNTLKKKRRGGLVSRDGSQLNEANSLENLSGLMKSREVIMLPGERKTHLSSDLSQSKTPVLEDGRGSYKTQGSGNGFLKSGMSCDDSSIKKINRSPTQEDIEAQIEENKSIRAQLEQVAEHNLEDTSRTYDNDQISQLLENKENKVHSMSNLSESLKEIDVAPIIEIGRDQNWKSPKNATGMGSKAKDFQKTNIYGTHDGSCTSNEGKKLLKKASSIYLSDGGPSVNNIDNGSLQSKQSERLTKGSSKPQEKITKVDSVAKKAGEVQKNRQVNDATKKTTTKTTTLKQAALSSRKPDVKDSTLGSNKTMNKKKSVIEIQNIESEGQEVPHV